MKNERTITDKLRYGSVFIFVAALHVLLLFFIVFTIEVTAGTLEIPPTVMKLADIEEETPPPPPPPPPPPLLAKERPPIELLINEPVAETVIEVEEVTPVELVVTTPASASVTSIPLARYGEEYLPQNKVSVLPRFDEKEIRSKLIYPSIALRSGLEGIVYLELYIDREGVVRRIVILKENPPGRGFGEAALKAFEGLHGKPAQANGEAVAVRYRYPVRFQIK